jgi:hypothetical protein
MTRRKREEELTLTALLAPASAGVYPDGKRPLPAVRLTRFDKRRQMQDRHPWEKAALKRWVCITNYVDKSTGRLEDALACRLEADASRPDRHQRTLAPVTR